MRCVRTSHLTPHTSHLTPHTSHLTPHTSHLTPHTSHLTPHTSHLTLHTSLPLLPLFHSHLLRAAPKLVLAAKPCHVLPPHPPRLAACARCSSALTLSCPVSSCSTSSDCDSLPSTILNGSALDAGEGQSLRGGFDRSASTQLLAVSSPSPPFSSNIFGAFFGQDEQLTWNFKADEGCGAWDAESGREIADESSTDEAGGAWTEAKLNVQDNHVIAPPPPCPPCACSRCARPGLLRRAYEDRAHRHLPACTAAECRRRHARYCLCHRDTVSAMPRPCEPVCQ
jgi:hypothetical protein